MPDILYFDNVTAYIAEQARLEAELQAAADMQVLLAIAGLVIGLQAALIVALVAVILWR